ncbi:hypothetical protein DPMN_150598 [Dreissena polymorpha]|uniref:Uncharacterized protein n=1 Tax=Dreissena polymorpha TaxID=45954 RepID=A0A9D4FEV8_DREPO|nr:hypothetical protein DPMN_150598 [Dreissena polymorpha]
MVHFMEMVVNSIGAQWASTPECSLRERTTHIQQLQTRTLKNTLRVFREGGWKKDSIGRI